MNAVELYIEDGDVRALWDGNTPTASKGFLLKRGGLYSLRGIQLNLLKLIRTGSSNVAVSVALGYTDVNEAQITGFAPEVGINTVSAGLSGAGAEQDTNLTAPYRRADAFHAHFNGSRSTSVQEVKAATTSKKHYITECTISTDTAGWISIVDGASTVLLGPYYMPANSVLPLKFSTPVPGSINTALNVDCDAATGNVTVDIEGYTI